jgi:hypothetical protein
LKLGGTRQSDVAGRGGDVEGNEKELMGETRGSTREERGGDEVRRRNAKGKRIICRAPMARGLTGLAKEAVACGARASQCGELGRLDRIPKKIQLRI